MAIDQWIEEAGRTYNVDPALLRVLVGQESGGNQSAVSPKGAIGLGQLMPATAAELGVDPRDPKQNIFGSAQYLSRQLDKYGDVNLALAAYNAGAGAVDQAGGIPNFPETQNYVRSIMAKYQGNTAPVSNDPLDAEFDALFAGSAPTQPADALDSEFDALFVAPEQPAVAAPAQPDQAIPPDPVMGGEVVPAAMTTTEAQPAPAREQFLGFDVPQNLGEVGGMIAEAPFAFARGGREGLRRVLDAPAEWLALGAEKSGLTNLLQGAGVDMLSEQEQIEANKARRAQEGAASAGDFTQGLGRVGGEIVGSVAPIAGVQAGLARGGNALLTAIRGTRAAPVAAPLQGAGRFLAGEGGLASRSVNAALQGGAGAALLSGGSDIPLSEQVGMGAGIGALFPAGYALASGVGQGAKNALGALVRPFSESGRAGIANQIARQEAVAAGGVPTSAVPYAQPGQAPTPFTPGPTGIPGAAPEAAPRLATSAEDLLGGATRGGRLEANFNEIIPGSKPTLSQATGNAGIATLERSMMARSSEAQNAFNELQQANNIARLNFFENMRGTGDDLAAAATQREEQAIPLLNTALENARPANANPVMAKIDEILEGPEGQRDAVVSALNAVKRKVDLGEGQGLQSDVRQLYGIRKSINDQLENVSGRDNTAAQLASKELLAVRNTLDEAIEGAAPGFKQYLKEYAELSKPINSMNYLQNLDLTDQTSQRLTLNNIKKAIVKIERERKKPGANNAKAISDEQMDGLYRLEADLRREANQQLGKGTGSDTPQKLRQNQLLDVMLGDVGGKVAEGAPATIGGGLGYLIGGVPGSALGAVIGQNVGAGVRGAVASQAPAVEANLLRLLTEPQGAELLQVLRQRAANPLAEQLLRRGRAAGAVGGQLSGQGAVGQ